MCAYFRDRFLSVPTATKTPATTYCGSGQYANANRICQWIRDYEAYTRTTASEHSPFRTMANHVRCRPTCVADIVECVYLLLSIFLGLLRRLIYCLPRLVAVCNDSLSISYLGLSPCWFHVQPPNSPCKQQQPSLEHIPSNVRTEHMIQVCAHGLRLQNG